MRKFSEPFTHWACFDCRKSFAKEEADAPRKCPECAEPMTDMGAYFEPPRKLNVKRWAVMKILADAGFRFNTKDAKIYIQNRILQAKNPRLADVIERIELEKQRKKNEIGNENSNDYAKSVCSDAVRFVRGFYRQRAGDGDSRRASC